MSAETVRAPVVTVGPRQLLLFVRECLEEIRRCAKSGDPADLAEIDEHARDGIKALERLEP